MATDFIKRTGALAQLRLLASRDAANATLALRLSIALFAGIAAQPAHAILTQAGGVAAHMTTTTELSTLELQAYDLQAEFRGFLATPIDPTHVLTAQHIGIDLADTVTIANGPDAGTYSIITWHDDPSTDLRIVEIDGTLTEYSLLNHIQTELGREFTVFGRGGAGNGLVTVSTEEKGWTTAGSGVISWGRNVFSSNANPLRANFDLNGLPREAGFSVGDSGGGWFIFDGAGQPRLAAITLATSGPYSFDDGGAPDGNPFNAVLYDRGGLWEGEIGQEVFEAENPQNRPGIGFGTRISDRIAWIESIIAVVEPDSDADGIPDGQDNCPYAANPLQTDTGGIGNGSAPDGIGDACQCGDVSGDGLVTSPDAFFIKRFGLGLNPFVFLQPGNCDVSGEGDCTGSDGSLVNAIAAGQPAALFGQNCENALP